MAEEHGCQSPEGHRLCANNCGFFGSTTTQDLCSKCYRDLFVKDQKKSKPDSFFTLAPSTSLIIPSLKVQPEDALLKVQQPEDDDAAVVVVDDDQPKRCSACRKKVGLTGFKCRCGPTFCGTHRYPEKHSCTFDFKAMGREAIAKANPLIKSHKLDRI